MGNGTGNAIQLPDFAFTPVRGAMEYAIVPSETVGGDAGHRLSGSQYAVLAVVIRDVVGSVPLMLVVDPKEIMWALVQGHARQRIPLFKDVDDASPFLQVRLQTVDEGIR